MYQLGIRNAKANALTRKLDNSPTIAKDDRIRYQHQTILTSNCLSINCIELDANVFIYDRIRKTNIDDEGNRRFNSISKLRSNIEPTISLFGCLEILTSL